MRTRGIVIAAITAGVLAGAVALAIAVNADVPDPEATAHDQVAPRRVPERPVPAPPLPASPDTPLPQRAPIPRGSAAGSGREDADAAELDELARTAGVRLPVARELRRAARLEERTSDPGVLTELLGHAPTGFMLATIGTQAKLLRDAAEQARAANREGTMSDDDAIRATRAAQDRYRAAYQRVTGLPDAQLDRFFAPDRPRP
ncbi:MAG: hypothetical protein JNL83_28020 [Myxococcales bacterium]|nr:hypothetical protein [Myxococcales bacterium]